MNVKTSLISNLKDKIISNINKTFDEERRSFNDFNDKNNEILTLKNKIKQLEDKVDMYKFRDEANAKTNNKNSEKSIKYHDAEVAFTNFDYKRAKLL